MMKGTSYNVYNRDTLVIKRTISKKHKDANGQPLKFGRLRCLTSCFKAMLLKSAYNLSNERVRLKPDKKLTQSLPPPSSGQFRGPRAPVPGSHPTAGAVSGVLTCFLNLPCLSRVAAFWVTVTFLLLHPARPSLPILLSSTELPLAGICFFGFSPRSVWTLHNAEEIF